MGGGKGGGVGGVGAGWVGGGRRGDDPPDTTPLQLCAIAWVQDPERLETTKSLETTGFSRTGLGSVVWDDGADPSQRIMVPIRAFRG
jgi:hypothetical protein